MMRGRLREPRNPIDIEDYPPCGPVPSASATSGAASASRPIASTTNVRCQAVIRRMVPSLPSGRVRRSRSAASLIARSQAANKPLTRGAALEQFRRSLSMRRMLELPRHILFGKRMDLYSEHFPNRFQGHASGTDPGVRGAVSGLSLIPARGAPGCVRTRTA